MILFWWLWSYLNNLLNSLLKLLNSFSRFSERKIVQYVQVNSLKYWRQLHARSKTGKHYATFWSVKLCGKCPNWNFLRFLFSCIRTEYGDLLCKSPYSVQIRENTDQKKLWLWTPFRQCNVYRNCKGKDTLWNFSSRAFHETWHTFMKYFYLSI